MTLPDRAVPDRGFRLSWLAVALALVAVGFVLATFVATRAADVDASLDNLRTNALPSVSHLLSAKAALHDLDVATEALATASPSERAARLDAALRERARVMRQIVPPPRRAEPVVAPAPFVRHRIHPNEG